ncbi:hypothetical protein T484DRAFT_1821003 [Baffinella frigidus]|nr:hypothetical protein T484DRAFT_1821003 [Cryptophyta sp. CCMP2293]
MGFARNRGQTSFAYRHPFAAGHKGMQHLVMAEFSQGMQHLVMPECSQDEESMKDTTDAIFGGKHKRRHKRSAQLSAAQTRVQKRLAETEARRGELAQQNAALHCSIEMLENGGCSDNKAPPPRVSSAPQAGFA